MKKIKQKNEPQPDVFLAQPWQGKVVWELKYNRAQNQWFSVSQRNLTRLNLMDFHSCPRTVLFLKNKIESEEDRSWK